MISLLTLESFKCFEKQDIPLRNLSVLTGTNASGKSSVIQAMLLLRQSVLRSRPLLRLRSLDLAGDLFDAGTAADIVNVNAPHRALSIGMKGDDSAELVAEFHYPPGDPHVRSLRRTNDGNDDSKIRREDIAEMGRLRTFSLFSGIKFAYLSADRLGPKATYPVQRKSDSMSGRTGSQGEFTAHVLATRGPLPVANQAWKDLATSEHGASLIGLTRYWLNEVIPGADIRAAASFERVDYSYFDVRINDFQTDYFRPTNTGFGISCCLPILVAGIQVPQGSLLIVENPEIHLHPQAQSRIGRFLAIVAAAGVQVIVETHSDHVMNGIRLAVRDNIIPAQSVAINFFSRTTKPSQYRMQEVQIRDDGELSAWPTGFFDQFDNDLFELLRPLPNK